MDLVTPSIGLVFWQSVTFLIVLFVLGKFVFPMISQAIGKREQYINDSLATAKEIEQRKISFDEQQVALKKQMELERDEILKATKVEANKMIAQAREEAAQAAAQDTKKALEEIENLKRTALAQIKSEVASISLTIAEKVLRANLTDQAAQKDLVNTYLEDFNLN